MFVYCVYVWFTYVSHIDIHMTDKQFSKWGVRTTLIKSLHQSHICMCSVSMYVVTYVSHIYIHVTAQRQSSSVIGAFASQQSSLCTRVIYVCVMCLCIVYLCLTYTYHRQSSSANGAFASQQSSFCTRIQGNKCMCMSAYACGYSHTCFPHMHTWLRIETIESLRLNGRLYKYIIHTHMHTYTRAHAFSAPHDPPRRRSTLRIGRSQSPPVTHTYIHTYKHTHTHMCSSS
jgi:hypothetical protein